MVPVIKISLDGQDISAKLAGRILEGRVQLHDGHHTDILSLTLSNFDGMLAKPKRGAKLAVALGFEGGDIASLGMYEVQEVQKRGVKAVFTLTAHAADMKKKLKGQKHRNWVKGETIGDIVKKLAGDNGLSAAVAPALAALKAGHIYQTGESDMHLLTRLARQFGAIGKIAEGKMVFAEKGAGQTVSGADIPGLVITPNDLEDDFSIGDRDRTHRGKVKAHHYDQKTGKRVESTAGESDGPDYVIPHLHSSKAAAERACKGRKTAFDQASKQFQGTLKSGDNRAKAGGVLTSQGFGDDDDHDWTLKTVTHQFSDHGYATSFEGEKKQAKAAAAPAGAAGGKAAPAKAASTGNVKEAGAAAPSNIG